MKKKNKLNHPFLNISGLSEKDFYSKYPTEESFFKDYPQFAIPKAQLGYTIDDEDLKIAGSKMNYTGEIYPASMSTQVEYEKAARSLDPYNEGDSDADKKNNAARIAGMIKSAIPNMNIDSSSLVDATSGLVNYMDNIQNKQRELEYFSKQLRPVVGSSAGFLGDGMPMYMQEGGDIPFVEPDVIDPYVQDVQAWSAKVQADTKALEQSETPKFKNFGEAFKYHRNQYNKGNNEGIFEYKGKSYTTQLASESSNEFNAKRIKDVTPSKQNIVSTTKKAIGQEYKQNTGKSLNKKESFEIDRYLNETIADAKLRGTIPTPVSELPTYPQYYQGFEVNNNAQVSQGKFKTLNKKKDTEGWVPKDLVAKDVDNLTAQDWWDGTSDIRDAALLSIPFFSTVRYARLPTMIGDRVIKNTSQKLLQKGIKEIGGKGSQKLLRSTKEGLPEGKRMVEQWLKNMKPTSQSGSKTFNNWMKGFGKEPMQQGGIVEQPSHLRKPYKPNRATVTNYDAYGNPINIDSVAPITNAVNTQVFKPQNVTFDNNEYYKQNSDGSIAINVNRHLQDRTAQSGRIGADYTYGSNRGYAYEGTYGNKDYKPKQYMQGPRAYALGGKIYDNTDARLAYNSPQGNGYEDFVTDPSMANVLAENGEMIQFPDGSTTNIGGDKHSDYSGGEYMNLPQESRIYSDKLKADKDFTSDLLGRKVKKKFSISDLAKKFDTSKEEKVLANTNADSIATRTAEINKGLKTAKLDEIFNYQEMIKDPSILDSELGIPTMQDGGQIGIRRGGLIGFDSQGKPIYDKYDANIEATYDRNLNTIGQERVPGFNPNASVVDRQRAVFNSIPDELVLDYARRVPPTNKGVQFQNMPDFYTNADTYREANLNDDLRGVRMLNAKVHPFGTKDEYDTFINDSTPIQGTEYYLPNSEIGHTNLTYIKPQLGLNKLPNASTIDQSFDITPTSFSPYGVSPLSFTAPSDETITSENPKGNKKRFDWGKVAQGVKNGFNDVGDFVPEIFMGLNAMSDFPIFTSKFQPRYNNPIELNVQNQLNRNYSQARELLDIPGNPSISNAQAQQTLANLYEADNQVMSQKYNADLQNRQQVEQYNNQLENSANQMNMQRMDQFWDKVTARRANKEQDMNTIINSAYSKAKNKLMEKRAMSLYGQMFPHYQYNPMTGTMDFVQTDNSGSAFRVSTTEGSSPEDDTKTEVTSTEQTDEKGRKKTTLKKKVRSPNYGRH